MSSVVKHWISTKLALPIPDSNDPAEFRRSLSNGFLIGEILRKYGVISDDQLIALGSNYTEKTKLKNMNYVERWTVDAGLDIKFSELMDILEEKPGAAIQLLFKLYFLLEGMALNCKADNNFSTEIENEFGTHEERKCTKSKPERMSKEEQEMGEEEEGEESFQNPFSQQTLSPKKYQTNEHCDCFYCCNPANRTNLKSCLVDTQKYIDKDLASTCQRKLEESQKNKCPKASSMKPEDDGLCNFERKVQECTKPPQEFSLKNFPIKGDTTEAANLYFASSALHKAKEDKRVLLQTLCSARIDRTICPDSRRIHHLKCFIKEEQDKGLKTLRRTKEEMDQYDEMVNDPDYLNKKDNSIKRPGNFRTIQMKVELQDFNEKGICEQVKYFRESAGPTEQPNIDPSSNNGPVEESADKKSLRKKALEENLELVRKIVRDLLNWSVDLAVELSEYKSETGSEPEDSLVSEWKNVLFHVPRNDYSLQTIHVGHENEDCTSITQDEDLEEEEGNVKHFFDENDPNWLLEEDNMVCDVNIQENQKDLDKPLAKILEEENKLKKLKDKVEAEFRAAQEMERYDERVKDPDYLKKLANRGETRSKPYQKHKPHPSLIQPNLVSVQMKMARLKCSRKLEAENTAERTRLRKSICARLIRETPAQVYDDLMTTAMEKALAICGKEVDLADFMLYSHKEKSIFYSHLKLEEEAMQQIACHQQDNVTLHHQREAELCRKVAHLAARHTRRTQYELNKARREIEAVEHDQIVQVLLRMMIDLGIKVAEYKETSGGNELPEELWKEWKELLRHPSVPILAQTPDEVALLLLRQEGSETAFEETGEDELEEEEDVHIEKAKKSQIPGNSAGAPTPPPNTVINTSTNEDG